MNDKLREALEEIEMDARVMRPYVGQVARLGKIAREALAASKPEPQAQAGEPEVFGYVKVAGALTQWSKQKPTEQDGWTIVELITLQSHREAMVRLQAERNSCEQQADYWQGEAADFAVAIAKKDAALKACVEALQKSEPYRTCHEEAHEAAITQAQEAMR